MTTVLVAEDDPAILRGVKDNLELEQFTVLTAGDGDTAYRMAHDRTPDVLILDLMLPRMSGYEVCRRLRADGLRVPILMLSARGEEGDRVLGLDLGADDYLPKPFSVKELIARVRALHRRSAIPPADTERLQTTRCVVDFVRFTCLVDGVPVAMTRKEFFVLRALVSRAGAVVTRAALLREVWGTDASPTTRTVDNHVALLRAKLEADPASPRHLVTVHGVGYKWVP